MANSRQIELIRHSLVSQGKRLAEIENKLADRVARAAEEGHQDRRCVVGRRDARAGAVR